MSKTNDTSRNELADSELDAVTGGSFELGNAVSAVVKSIGAVGTSSGPPDVWVGFGWVPGRW
jgi:hypothetical protein